MKINLSSILPRVALLTSLAFIAQSSQAAVITWSPATAVSTGIGNSSDVSTNGTVVEAFNAATTGYNPGTIIVNGVTFTSTLGLLPADHATSLELSSGTNGGDATYDALLSSFDLGGGDSITIVIGDGDGDTTVTGAGLLQIGQLYEIQVWFVDDRNDRVMGFASSSSDTVVEVNDAYAIGTFTADATTQTLFLDTVFPTTDFGNTHLTAYQIRLIPEPSSALLGGLTILGLLLRRRRH